jgi:hypothetical protein
MRVNLNVYAHLFYASSSSRANPFQAQTAAEAGSSVRVILPKRLTGRTSTEVPSRSNPKRAGMRNKLHLFRITLLSPIISHSYIIGKSSSNGVSLYIQLLAHKSLATVLPAIPRTLATLLPKRLLRAVTRDRSSLMIASARLQGTPGHHPGQRTPPSALISHLRNPTTIHHLREQWLKAIPSSLLLLQSYSDLLRQPHILTQ